MIARKRTMAVASMALLAGSLGTLNSSVRANDRSAEAVLRNAAGTTVGKMEFVQRGNKSLVKVDGTFPVVDDATADPAASFKAGFHGFHIHAGTECVAPFATAGGHFNPAGATHKDHAGDMPVILVNEDGTAIASFRSDRINVADPSSPKYIVGKVVIVHFLPDNYAAVPTAANPTGTTTAQQYTPNSDGTTNSTATGLTANTGNAGNRYSCGVIEPADAIDRQ